MYSATNWTSVIVTDMLGAIVTARLHAMYHGSRMMLTFLIVIFLALNISWVVLVAIGMKQVIGEEVILSGTHVCSYDAGGNAEFLTLIIWILIIAWEVLALCLVLWIAVKQFRYLRRLRLSAGSIIVDMFTMLVKSHIRYFASFLAVACLQLRRNSPNISGSTVMETAIYDGALQILATLQMFVLGPRLILTVREYNAKLVDYSDTGTHMTSIAFQGRTHVSTSNTVDQRGITHNFSSMDVCGME